ncbi:MAG: hypothetical protein ACEQSF_02655 [Solirubrobacteraceae bacterium]
MKYEWEKAGSPKSSTRYDPTAGALLSFLVTGGGQVYAGETRRGILFFLGSVASTAVTIVGLSPESKPITCSSYCPGYVEGTSTAANSLGVVFLGVAASIGIKIWSIADASKTADVKNYHLKKQNEKTLESKTSLFSNPSLTPMVINNKKQLIPGLGLSLNF